MSFKIIPVFFMPVMVSEEVYKISKKEINYVNQLIKKKGELPSKSHIKSIYKDNGNPSSSQLSKAFKQLAKEKYIRKQGSMWKWESGFAWRTGTELESVNEVNMAHVYLKDLSKKKFKDLGIYLWHVLDLAINKDFRITSNGKLLAVNVDKINSKSLQNIKKRFGVDLQQLAKESVNEGFTKYHIRLTDTPGWYGVWDKNGKQKFEGDRRYVMRQLKKLKTRMGNVQLKSLIDVATKRKGKNIEFDVVESVNEVRSKTITAIGSIIGKKQAKKIGGVLVDIQTANVIMKVWNALNKSNRSKFEKLPIKKMATVAWKLVK